MVVKNIVKNLEIFNTHCETSLTHNDTHTLLCTLRSFVGESTT